MFGNLSMGQRKATGVRGVISSTPGIVARSWAFLDFSKFSWTAWSGAW